MYIFSPTQIVLCEMSKVLVAQLGFFNGFCLRLPIRYCTVLEFYLLHSPRISHTEQLENFCGTILLPTSSATSQHHSLGSSCVWCHLGYRTREESLIVSTTKLSQGSITSNFLPTLTLTISFSAHQTSLFVPRPLPSWVGLRL